MTHQSKRIKSNLIEIGNATLNEILDSNQKRARVNVLTIDDIIQIANQAEDELEDLGIAPTSRTGATYAYHDAGPAATSYKYRQGCSLLEIVRKANGWHLLDLCRIEVYPHQKAFKQLTLTEAQHVRALKVFNARFKVKAN